MKYNRGGKTLKVGDIGKLGTLRQHLLLPGEVLNTSISGNVRLSGLRQQTSVYLHASIEAFAAPLRWYWDDFTDFIQEGLSTAHVVPTVDWTADPISTTELGLGEITQPIARWYAAHPANVHNEWYRWPEDAKTSVTAPIASFQFANGPKCVNLPSAATRMHDAPVMDATETDVPSATVLDVRDLEKIQARLNQAAVSDWSSQDRYQPFMRDVFGANGTNEVDKIPIRLKSGATLSVMPRDMYATDGASLGEIMSINNFQVNHKWGGFKAPEHMIVSYHMLLRFAPIFAQGVAPGIYPADVNYAMHQAGPNTIETYPPVAVKSREINMGDGTVVGYLPHGWQYREGYNHVDRDIRNLANFPVFSGMPQTAAGYRDPTFVEAAFRSLALRHWFADLDFKCNVDSYLGEAGKSIVVGSGGKKGPKGNHPVGGFLM